MSQRRLAHCFTRYFSTSFSRGVLVMFLGVLSAGRQKSI
nr:MAG TPA: hypothetical protein [Caudoviricetes sp.]